MQPTIEQEIQAKGLTAPRITPADIEADIVSEQYFTAADGVAGAGPVIAAEFWNRENGHAIVDYSERTHVGHLTADKGYERRPLVHRPEPTGPLAQLTFCVLILKNGAKVVGINYGAIDPVQHSAETGRREARKQAIEKMYELLGFRLRDKLAQAEQYDGSGI